MNIISKQVIEFANYYLNWYVPTSWAKLLESIMNAKKGISTPLKKLIEIYN